MTHSHSLTNTKKQLDNNNELFWGNNLKVIILMGSKTSHNERCSWLAWPWQGTSILSCDETEFGTIPHFTRWMKTFYSLLHSHTYTHARAFTHRHRHKHIWKFFKVKHIWNNSSVLNFVSSLTPFVLSKKACEFQDQTWKRVIIHLQIRQSSANSFETFN